MEKQFKAHELAKKQREISIAEFFAKNRHLLGFDNKRKALLTTIKEAVDNSLDACEEMKVLPEITIQVKPVKEKIDRYIISIEDNGPGIIKEQIPKIFGKLLYGSKFHTLKVSRGQQGIGISASCMYGQLTTGKSVRIWSTIGKGKPSHYYELHIDTQKNEPEIIKDLEVDWKKENGTKIEIELEAKYQKGKQSVDEYLKQTAIANPHANLIYINPENEKVEFPRVTKELPIEPKEIKPHPYGVELGVLIKMLKSTKAKTLKSFLIKDFSRVTDSVVKKICARALLNLNSKPDEIANETADRLYKAIQETKIMSPPTNCLSPIGENTLLKGLKKEISADFYATLTRKPSVYRGFPFVVEVALAYGGELPLDDLIKVYRFANRVPLLYQQSAGAISKAIISTSWRGYGLSQSKGVLPSGPMILLVHINSVWVPFTSESKEAVAHYPEILKEIKLALQDVGRQLGSYIRKKLKKEKQMQRKKIFEIYIDELTNSLSNLEKINKSKVKKDLLLIANKTIGA